MPVAARAGWLDGLSGARAERRSVLSDLLATQARFETDDFLAELPKLPDASLRAETHQAASPLGAGALVGPYQLIFQGRGQHLLDEHRDPSHRTRR